MPYKKQEILALHWSLDSPPVFVGVRVAHLFSFPCCVFRYVCLRPVSCVPEPMLPVSLVCPYSWLPLRFSLTFILLTGSTIVYFECGSCDTFYLLWSNIFIMLDLAKKKICVFTVTRPHPIFQPPTLTFFIGNYSTLIFANNFYTEFG